MFFDARGFSCLLKEREVNVHKSFCHILSNEKFANFKDIRERHFAKYFLPLCFVYAKKFYGKSIAVVEIKQIDL